MCSMPVSALAQEGSMALLLAGGVLMASRVI
jgi:hypothetical protein